MTKNRVLSLLKRTDGFLSGEQISAEIGVSRMAVSTAVKALRVKSGDEKTGQIGLSGVRIA